MTVIFQLFCAEDLQRFRSKDDLDSLKKTIAEALGLDKDTPCKTSEGFPALPLGASEDTHLPEGTPPGIIDALKKRFDEVSQQLKSPPRDSSSFDFETLKKRHFNEKDSVEDAKEAEILQWAISCEVNNYKFYAQLLHARDVAYRKFHELTQQRPKGPDSLYSPFNPLHPLYNYFPPPPMRPTPTQSIASGARDATSSGSPPPAGPTSTQGKDGPSS